MARAAQIMFRDTAERPYFFRKVIRKPKPMNIMTWTSWNTEAERKVLAREINIVQTECYYWGKCP